ncbi:MAG: helix-turn-helix domain-containing protein [Pseudomonadota bacterium]
MTHDTGSPAQSPLPAPSQPGQTSGTPSSETAAAAAPPSQPHTPALPPFAGDAKAYYKMVRAAFPEMRIGQVLRHVREASGLSIDDVHAATHQSVQKLISIERMEVSGLTRGYITPLVRNFAVAVGLDSEQVVRDYAGDCGALQTPSLEQGQPGEARAPSRMWVAPALLAAAALGLVALGGGIWALAAGPREAPIQALATEPLNGATESLFADMPMNERVRVQHTELTLVAVEDAWVEVRGPDGTLYRNRIMGRGETYIPRTGAGWTISARNGAAFQWRLGDAVIGPLGPAGTPVFAASVDTAAQRAEDAAAPALAAAGNGQPSR